MNRETLTALHDSAEDSVVSVQCAAVPAVVSKLVLALADPLLTPLTDRLHHVWIFLTQLPLLIHQAWDIITYHPRSQCANVPATHTHIYYIHIY